MKDNNLRQQKMKKTKKQKYKELQSEIAELITDISWQVGLLEDLEVKMDELLNE